MQSIGRGYWQAAIAGAVLVVFSAAGAGAQLREPVQQNEEQQPVRMILRGAQPNLSIRIRSLLHPEDEAICPVDCMLRAHIGLHEIEVSREGLPPASRTWNLRRSEVLTVSAPDPDARTAGWIAAGVGGALFLTGVTLLSYAWTGGPADCLEPHCRDAPGWTVPVGFGAIIASALAIPVGVVTAVRSSRPRIRAVPLDDDSARTQ
jgi:hypothetical protein